MLKPIFLAAALALSACAAQTQTADTATPGESDCFRVQSISGYGPIEERTLVVRVGASRSYVFTAMSSLRDLETDFQIAIESPTGRICTGRGLGAEIHKVSSPTRSWPVTQIARVPEAAPAQQGS
jgi:Family of unknown function (DUF6491)